MEEREVLLLRFDEIWLKGRNRNLFLNQLVKNLEAQAGVPRRTVVRRRGRVIIDPAPVGVEHRLQEVFGLKSLSRALVLPRKGEDPTPEALFQRIREEAVRRVSKALGDGTGGTFRIDARRADKGFPWTSMELNRQLGAAVLEALPDVRVQLDGADVSIGVEVRRHGVYVFDATLPGPGGMPVGSGGRALVLLSGGLDSPVAAYRMQQRGVRIAACYFHTPPHTGERAREKVLDLARRLAVFNAAPVKLYIPHFTDIQLAITGQVPEPFWTLSVRRFMYRLANRLARRDGYQALITGEAVGQVASQTLENLSCTNSCAERLVLRPLCGMDKYEIVAISRKAGFFDISTRPFEDCCHVFTPQNPRTKARPHQCEAAEATLDAEALVRQALRQTEVVEVDTG